MADWRVPHFSAVLILGLGFQNLLGFSSLAVVPVSAPLSLDQGLQQPLLLKTTRWKDPALRKEFKEEKPFKFEFFFLKDVSGKGMQLFRQLDPTKLSLAEPLGGLQMFQKDQPDFRVQMTFHFR